MQLEMFNYQYMYIFLDIPRRRIYNEFKLECNERREEIFYDTYFVHSL